MFSNISIESKTLTVGFLIKLPVTGADNKLVFHIPVLIIFFANKLPGLEKQWNMWKHVSMT